MKIFFLILISNILMFCSVSAQDSLSSDMENKAAFYSFLDRAKIDYKIPRGYKPAFVPQNAHIGPILLSSSRHQLENLNDSVFIYFNIELIDTSQTYVSKMKRFGFAWDMNKNYLQTHSDTLKFPIERNPKNYTAKNFNADVSGHFEMPIQQNYKDKYSRCRVAFIHKENQADILLYFFYNRHNATTISKHIDKVLDNIKFINK